MDLEVLNLKADASSVEKATDAIEALDNKLSRAERTVAKAEQALKILRGEAVKVGDGVVRLGDGFTKSQANMLAMLKQAGATTAELKAMAKTMDQLNKITSTNPFDKSVQALNYVKKQREELTKSIKYAERYNDLTKEQISLMTRGIESVRQRAASEQKNFGEREAAVKKFIKEFVKEAQSYNQVTSAIEEKNRVAKEELRLQQEQSRAAQVSAKQRADAEGYVQETLRRTLFINEQLEKGMSVSGANSLYAYKQQLDVLGLSADQAAAKMREFQNALTQNQTLRADRSPLNQLNTQMRQTREEVNHLARAVSVQLGDVFVSLAGGMNPLLVAIQQGDQIRFALQQVSDQGIETSTVMRGALTQMANSFILVGQVVGGFFADAFRTIGGVFSGLILQIPLLGDLFRKTNNAMELSAALGSRFAAGMLKVAGAISIGFGALTSLTTFLAGAYLVALFKADQQQTQLAKSLGQYGASLGIAAQDARSFAVASEESTASVVAAIGAIAKAGGFTADQMKVVAESAAEMNRVFGISIEDVVNQYKELQKDPIKALLELQSRTGEVNSELLKKIRTMQEEGRQYDAISAAMDEYAAANKRTTDRTIENLGVIATVLNKISEGWRLLYKEIESLAASPTALENLLKAGKEVEELRKATGSETDKFRQEVLKRELAVAEQNLEVVKKTWVEENRANELRRQKSELAKIELKYSDDVKNAQPEQIKFAQKQLQLQNDYNKALAAGASPEFLTGLSRLMQKNADDYIKSLEKTTGATTSKRDEVQDYFKTLLEQTSDLSNKAAEELSKLNDGYSNITASQKMLNDLQDNEMWNKLPENLKQVIKAKIEKNVVDEKEIQNLKAQLLLQEQLAEYYEIYRGIDADIAKESAEIEYRNSLLFATEEQAKAIQRQYEKNLKVAEVENKYLGIRTKLVNDYLNMLRSGVSKDTALEQFNRAIEEVGKRQEQELSLVHERVAVSAAEDYAAKFKEIQGTVTDIVATAMFEGGKAGSKKLKDVLNAEFRKYVIDVFINPIVGSIMGSITGGAGSSGQSSGGVTGLISNASSAYNLATGSTIAGISGVVQGAGAFLGSSAISSFGAGMTMTGTQVAALSEAGLVASKGAASLGSTFATVMPWIAGGLLVADLLGVFDKKPSDKTSWAVIDPTTGRLGEVGDMGGKKAASEEQKTANAQFSQLIGGFAALTGITGKLVTAMGSRDGIRLAIEGGFDTPMGQAAGGSWLDGQTAYNYGSDPATAAVKMMEDLLDEGTLSQSVIDGWNTLKTTAEGTTKDAVELIGNLDLLVAGFDEEAVRRADLIQQDNESIQNAFMRMKEYERILSGGIAQPGDLMADVVNKLQASFESLGLAFPTTVEGFNGLIGGLDMTSDAGKQAYVALMELFPAWLELETAQNNLYEGLKTSQEKVAQSSSDMSMLYEDLGISIPRSAQELRGLIDAQDASTEAGAKLKAQLLGTVPAYLEWQEQMVNSFGITADSIRDIFSTVLQESGSAKEAAQKASEMFSQQVYDALLGSVLNSVTEMVFSGIITPMINSLVSQTAVAATNMAVGGTIAGTAVSTGGMLAGQELAAIVDKINVYLGAMSQILSDPAIKAAIENISKTVGNVAGSIYTTSGRKQPTSNTQAGATSNGRDETDKLADSLKKYSDENKRMQAELLELQGRTQEAKDLLRALAIEGLTTLEVKAYDANQALRNQIEAMKEAQRVEKEIADQRNSLETQLLQLQGNTVELRRRELEALHESNRGLQEMIWSLEDAKTAIEATKEASIKGADVAMDAVDKAFNALQRAVDREKEVVQSRIDVLENSLSKLKGVFDFLKTTIDSLLGGASSVSGMRLSQANEVIQKALLSGIIPDEKAFEDAVGIAVQGVDKGIYASRADQERATILLANDLSKINLSVGDQISETERLIALEKKELERLDKILETAQRQINVLKGIDNSVISVGQAINNLAAAILGAEKAKIAAAAAPYVAIQSTIAANYSASGGVVNSNAAKPVSSAEKTIADIYKNVLGRDADIGGLNYYLSSGLTTSQIEASIKGSAEAATRAVSTDVQNAFLQGVASSVGQTTNIKAYADGGYYSGGLAVVGEEGPELINFSNPGMVYTAAQTSNLLSGGGGLEEAVEALRDEVVMLRAETRAIVSNTSKSARLLDRAMPDGQSILVTTTA